MRLEPWQLPAVVACYHNSRVHVVAIATEVALFGGSSGQR